MRLMRHERAVAGALTMFLLAGTVALCAAVCGCVYRGAKVTEGVDLAVGLTVPGTEGAVQFNALNWLSGFRLGVAENSDMAVEYVSVASNSYFGVIRTETEKRVKATVTPRQETVGAATKQE